MPLQNAPHQRIYPEFAHPRDTSSAIPQDNAGAEHLPIPADPVMQTPLPATQIQPQKAYCGQRTPLRERLHANNAAGYHGPADRHDQPPQTTLKQPGPMRAGSESQRATNGHTAKMTARPGTSSAASKQAALAMKMEVPDTMRLTAPPMKHQTSQSTDTSGQERSRAGKALLPTGNAEYAQPPTAYEYEDDDTSATFDTGRYDNYGEGDLEAQGEPTAILHSAPLVPSHVIEQFAGTIGPEELDAARARYGAEGNHRNFRTQSDQISASSGAHAGNMHGSFLRRDDETEVFANPEDREDMMPHQHAINRETPSKPPVSGIHGKRRSGKASTSKKVSVQEPEADEQAERESSPLIDPNLPQYQHYSKEHLEEFKQEQMKKQQSRATAPAKPKAPAVSKVPESQETSEDERINNPVPAQTTKKRTIDEIDYDIEKLQTMSYEDLDSVSFSLDPRASIAKPAVDVNGTTVSLEQRLSSLSRMGPDDQKALFRSLTDSENQEAGQWFVQSFANDLKRLMEVRLERRKKALTYEMEAKKRQKEAETKSADLDTELADLKKGGSQLIEGRSSPRPAKAG